MSNRVNETRAAYDHYYRHNNYFGYRNWLYRPFIKAIIGEAELKKGANVLDVGCGQGFFSSLFADEGMATLGVDLSPEGIQSASRTYGRKGLNFVAADIFSFRADESFDLVFSRSCSLYNSSQIVSDRSTTDTLLRFVRPNGVLVVDYHTTFSPRKHSRDWLHHSLATYQAHFSVYSGTRIYFSLRLAPIVLRQLAFSTFFSRLDSKLSRAFGIGGELLAFVRKST